MNEQETVVGRIGRGIRIKGTVRGKEDLVVEGEVDGTITLPDHHVVLDLPSRTTAEVRARNTTLRGRHKGDAEASEMLEITAEACVIGNVTAPRLVIREGAKFRGAVEMDVPLPPDLEAGSGTTATSDPAAATGTTTTAPTASKNGASKKSGRAADGKQGG